MLSTKRIMQAFCLAICTTGASNGFADGRETDELDALRQELRSSQQQVQDLSKRLESLESRATPSIGGDDTSERIDLLEEILFDLDERVGDRALVRAFDASSLDIGGFITQQYTVAVGEDQTQDAFNATQFELLIGADITDNVSFFTALGFLREADLDLSNPQSPFFRNFANRTPNIISWANYRHSEAVNIRAGRFVTPHGIINIEHFPPALLEINQPQFLRPFSGNSIFPNFLSGVEAHGKFFLGEDNQNVLSYNLYSGHFNGPDNADNLLTGLRGQLKWSNTGFTFGANYARGQRGGGGATLATTQGNFSSTPAGSITTNDYDLLGLDVLYDKGAFLWKTELFYTNEIGAPDRVGFYTQPAYRFNDQWLAFYRFDYFDPGQGIGDSNEHVIGVNYLPVPTVRLRGEVIFRHENGSGGRGTTSADTLILQLSATYSF